MYVLLYCLVFFFFVMFHVEIHLWAGCLSYPSYCFVCVFVFVYSKFVILPGEKLGSIPGRLLATWASLSSVCTCWHCTPPSPALHKKKKTSNFLVLRTQLPAFW